MPPIKHFQWSRAGEKSWAAFLYLPAWHEHSCNAGQEPVPALGKLVLLWEESSVCSVAGEVRNAVNSPRIHQVCMKSLSGQACSQHLCFSSQILMLLPFQKPQWLLPQSLDLTSMFLGVGFLGPACPSPIPSPASLHTTTAV